MTSDTAAVTLISWDEARGNYLIHPSGIASRTARTITTTSGDVFTLRRSGRWVLRHSSDSVYSPRIKSFAPCVEHWME